MLVGMALYQWGVLSANRPADFYNKLIVCGLLAGLPLVLYGVYDNFSREWDPLYALLGPGSLFNYFGSLFISIAYVGVVMRIVQSELFCALKGRLASVGRMGTNYLMHSVIATSIFYGHGFGLFGTVPRWGQLLIVLLIWCLQLFLSAVWLRRFRFGPFEWLWRSLIYLRLQPMRQHKH